MAGVGGRNPARYEQRRTSEPVRPLVFVGCRAAWRVTAGSRGGRVGARGSDPHHHPREPRIADGRGVRRYRRGGGGGGGLAPPRCWPPGGSSSPPRPPRQPPPFARDPPFYYAGRLFHQKQNGGWLPQPP